MAKQQLFDAQGNPIRKKKKWPFILGAIVVVGIIGSQAGGDEDKTPGSTTKPSVSQSVDVNATTMKPDPTSTPEPTATPIPTEPELSMEEYVATCIEVPFKDLMRNPDQYIGQDLKIVGEISQYLSGGFLREEAFTMYEDYDIMEHETFLSNRWYVHYAMPDTDRILEDDIVTFYGEFNGVEELTTVLGSKMETLRLEGKFHEINNP